MQVPIKAPEGISSPGGGGTMESFPLALSLFGCWPGSECSGQMVPP